MKKIVLFSIAVVLAFAGCKKKDTATKTTSTPPPAPRLIFKFTFDSTQIRLNGLGQKDSVIPSNHRAQSPRFNGMSGHYIEMARTDYDSVGKGAVLYVAPSVTTG